MWTTKVYHLLATAALIWLPGAKLTLTAYDCSEAQVTNTFSVNDVLMPCIKPPPPTARSVRAEIYEIQDPKTVVGYRCQIRFRQSLVDWRGNKRPLPVATFIMGREACLNAHKLGYVDLENRVPHLEPRRTTKYSVRTVHADVKINNTQFIPGFHDHYYERDYAITLSQHSGVVDFPQNIVRFDNGMYCDFSNFSCFDDLIGELAWTSDLQQNLSTSIFGGDITLVSINETHVIPERTYAVMQVMHDFISFRVLNKNVTIGGRTVFRTDHPDIYIGDPLTKSKIFWPHFSYDKLHEYVNLTGSYSQRLSEVGRYEPTSHLDIARRLCLRDGVNMTYYCNPSSYLFAISCAIPPSHLGIKSITHLGSLRTVAKCQQKMVQIRVADECFSSIPVIDELHREQFLDPMSRVLANHAKRIVCNNNNTAEKLGFVENSTSANSSGKDPVKQSETGRLLSDWALLTLIVLTCVWVLYGMIKLAELITRKRHYLVSIYDESMAGRFLMSSWLYLKGISPRWKRRVGVQEETELNVNFPANVNPPHNLA